MQARQEMSELRRASEELRRGSEEMKGEIGRVEEQLLAGLSRVGVVTGAGRGRGKSSGLLAAAGMLVEWAGKIQAERKDLASRLFGPEGAGRSMEEVVEKVEGLYEERDGLLLELEELQHSSSKLAEDHIYHLKQANEELHSEIDRLSAQHKTSTRELASCK